MRKIKRKIIDTINKIIINNLKIMGLNLNYLYIFVENNNNTGNLPTSPNCNF